MSGGVVDGFPCDGSRVGTSSAGGGQRADGPDAGGAPAAIEPQRWPIGEGIPEVRANGSSGADAVFSRVRGLHGAGAG